MEKVSINIWDINNYNFKTPGPVHYTIVYNFTEYNFIVNYKPDSTGFLVIQSNTVDEYTVEMSRENSPVREFIQSSDFTSVHYLRPVIYNDKINRIKVLPTLPDTCLNDIADILRIIFKELGEKKAIKYFYGDENDTFDTYFLAEKMHGVPCLYFTDTQVNEKPNTSSVINLINDKKNATYINKCKECIKNGNVNNDISQFVNNQLKSPDKQLLELFSGIDRIIPVIINADKSMQSFVNQKLIPFLIKISGNRLTAEKIHTCFLNSDCLEVPLLKSLTGNISDFINDEETEQIIDFGELFRNRLSYFLSTYDIQKVPQTNKYFSPMKKAIQVANKIIHKNMLVHRTLVGYAFESIETFNWNVRTENHADTYQNYLQSLVPCDTLIRVFQHTRKNYYLKYCLDIFNSWYKYASHQENTKINLFLWKDHPAALRAEILCKLLYLLKNNKHFQEADVYRIIDILYASGMWLADSVNYYFNHNHGIMQDRALIVLGHCMNRPDWTKLATDRLIMQEKNAFNTEHVHTENSSQYAYFVAELFRKIANYLTSIGNENANLFSDALNSITEYQSWLKMPNGYLVQTGDSCYKIPKIELDEQKDFHKIYPKSGLYFYRSRQRPEENPIDRTYKFFKCGCSSRVHKHADDLSFILYSKGREIFVDGGFPGYESDECRRYFVSSKAHNTILVDGEGYYFDDYLSKNLNFIDYRMGNDFDSILAESFAFKGINIRRRFVSIDDFTFIRDSIISLTKHTYSQMFHIGENLELVQYDDHGLLIKINDDYFVKLIQFNKNTRISVFVNGNNITGENLSKNTPNQETEKGSENSSAGENIQTGNKKEAEKSISKTAHGFGYRALDIGKIRSITTVKFDICNSFNAEFKTGIFIINKQNRIRMSEQSVDFDLNSIKFGNEKIVIGNRVFQFGNEDTAFSKPMQIIKIISRYLQ